MRNRTRRRCSRQPWRQEVARISQPQPLGAGHRLGLCELNAPAVLPHRPCRRARKILFLAHVLFFGAFVTWHGHMHYAADHQSLCGMQHRRCECSIIDAKHSSMYEAIPGRRCVHARTLLARFAHRRYARDSTTAHAHSLLHPCPPNTSAPTDVWGSPEDTPRRAVARVRTS